MSDIPKDKEMESSDWADIIQKAKKYFPHRKLKLVVTTPLRVFSEERNVTELRMENVELDARSVIGSFQRLLEMMGEQEKIEYTRNKKYIASQKIRKMNFY